MSAVCILWGWNNSFYKQDERLHNRINNIDLHTFIDCQKIMFFPHHCNGWHKPLFAMSHPLFSRHQWVQFADTHLLEWQRVCEPTRRLWLCVQVWSRLQQWLPTGRGNQTQWGGLETDFWPLCYMLLQGTEDEHILTNSLHFVIQLNRF